MRQTFRARLVARPAVVGVLPVIRTAATAARTGVPVAAVALDERGRRAGAGEATLYAVVEGRKFARPA